MRTILWQIQEMIVIKLFKKYGVNKAIHRIGYNVQFAPKIWSNDKMTDCFQIKCEGKADVLGVEPNWMKLNVFRFSYGISF